MNNIDRKTQAARNFRAAQRRVQKAQERAELAIQSKAVQVIAPRPSLLQRIISAILPANIQEWK